MRSHSEGAELLGIDAQRPLGSLVFGAVVFKPIDPGGERCTPLTYRGNVELMDVRGGPPHATELVHKF